MVGNVFGLQNAKIESLSGSSQFIKLKIKRTVLNNNNNKNIKSVKKKLKCKNDIVIIIITFIIIRQITNWIRVLCPVKLAH